MIDYFNKYKSYIDYIPLVLVGLIFLSESDLEKHAFKTGCQICITVACLTIFYICSLNFTNGKVVGLCLAAVLWLILIYLKRSYLL